MPKPTPPARRPDAPLRINQMSNLARIYGVNDRDFSKYTLLRRSRGQYGKIEEYAESMAVNPHPLVHHAAGSAFMELALYHRYTDEGQPASPSQDFENRTAQLVRAKEHWLQASEGLIDMAQNERELRRKHSFTFMGFQAMQLAAYAQLMEVPAAWLAHVPLPSDEVAKRQRTTIEKVSHLAKAVLDLPQDSDWEIGTRSGLVGEMACGIVGLSDDNPKYVLLPASLRQDHNKAPEARADFIAVSSISPHFKALMQVGGSSKNTKSKVLNNPKAMFVDAQRDVVLEPGGRADDTLQGFIDAPHENSGYSTEIENRLTVLGRVMTMRLDAFNAARQGGVSG